MSASKIHDIFWHIITRNTVIRQSERVGLEEKKKIIKVRDSILKAKKKGEEKRLTSGETRSSTSKEVAMMP